MAKPETPSDIRIAVIGAGVCGLTCARHLMERGFSPTVFEKGRGIGGRLATRRVDDGTAFDHGAQYVIARSSAFQEVVERSIESGFADYWRPTGRDPVPPGSQDWVVGVPGMNALIKPLASGMDVRLGSEVVAIDRHAGTWCVLTQSETTGEFFDIVVLTAPAPQSKSLVASRPALQRTLDRVSIAPCWALMVAFETPSNIRFDVHRPKSEELAWIARNSSKPERGTQRECWVVHASPSWSARNLEKDRDAIVQELIGLLTDSFKADLPQIHHAVAHRWRYALTTASLGRPFLCSDDRTLFIGGDWCLGARVESAFESGQAIAAALTAHLKGTSCPISR